MTTYVILLPGDEATWESATPEHRAAMYAEHERFSRTLGERGHKVVGGARLPRPARPGGPRGRRRPGGLRRAVRRGGRAG